MASTVSLEGVQKAFLFPFEGKDRGTKLLLGAAINFANFFIPLVPSVLILGYAGQIMKAVIRRDEDPAMPEWTDWGAFFGDGIRLAGVAFLYSLPGILVTIFGYLVMVVLGFGFNMLGGMLSVNLNQSGTLNPGPMLLSFAASMGMTFFGMFCMMIGFLLMLAAILIYPAAMGNMIARGSFAGAFRFREWWPLFKANLGGYLVAFFLTLGLGMMMLFMIQILYVSVVLCFLLPFVGSLLGYFMILSSYTLFAVAYRDAQHRLGATPA